MRSLLNTIHDGFVSLFSEQDDLKFKYGVAPSAKELNSGPGAYRGLSLLGKFLVILSLSCTKASTLFAPQWLRTFLSFSSISITVYECLIY
jgi:hypothetical protein